MHVSEVVADDGDNENLQPRDAVVDDGGDDVDGHDDVDGDDDDDDDDGKENLQPRHQLHL